MIAKKVFGDKSEYIAKLNKIRFSPSMVWSGMDRSIYNSTFESGKRELINLINVMLEDINLSNVLDVSQNPETHNSELSENIFIVHGHNEEMKQSSARFLEKIQPGLLSERFW